VDSFSEVLNDFATGQRTTKLPSGSAKPGWINTIEAASALKKIRLLLILVRDRSKSCKGTVTKNNNRPPNNKKEHAETP
jgi:hypothetical protein